MASITNTMLRKARGMKPSLEKQTPFRSQLEAATHLHRASRKQNAVDDDNMMGASFEAHQGAATMAMQEIARGRRSISAEESRVVSGVVVPGIGDTFESWQDIR